MTGEFHKGHSTPGFCPVCRDNTSATTLRETITEDTKSVTTYLNEHEDDLIDLALALISIDSQNPPGDTREVIEYIETVATDVGLETERVVEDESKPNLIITIPGARETTLLYSGHVDTVPFDPDSWTRDPLGERVGGRLYGRGANDMKGAVAAMLHTARAYAETGTVPPVSIKLALVSGEETADDAGLPALLERNRLSADACLIGETTCEAGSHSVTLADKGSIWLTIESKGEGAHGSRPPLGENAIDTLIESVEEIGDYLGQVEFDLDDELTSIIEESVSFYAPRMGTKAAWRLFTTPTLNLGTFEGGGTINQVPENARAEIDIRLTAGVQTPEILSGIEERLDDYPRITIRDVSWSIGTYESFESPLVKATTQLAHSIIEEPIHRRSATGGGDAKTFRNEGISTIEFAFGTDTSHSVDENVQIEALIANAHVFSELPFGFAELVD